METTYVLGFSGPTNRDELSWNGLTTQGHRDTGTQV